VRRGEIGVDVQTITPLMAAGLALSQDWGVIVSDVDPAGPAARAGVQPGDIILSLDGKPMENGRQLQVNFYTRAIGQSVSLQVLRAGQPLAIRVQVAERADDPSRFAEMVRPEEHLVPRLGVLGLNLDDRLMSLLPALRRREGVVVAAVAADAPVSRQGQLEPGDVIYAVNTRSIDSLADLRAAIADVKPGRPAVLQIERNGRLMYVGFALE
jgi:serine protease Do